LCSFQRMWRSWKGRSAALLCLTGAVVVGFPGPGEAETCDKGCKDSLKDAQGCCPRKPVTTTTPQTTTKPPPKTTGGTSPCAEGKLRTADTGGLCCWPGQVTNGTVCVGIPTSCPGGYQADAKSQSCIPKACPDGMIRPANDRAQCCWPGQGWSSQRNVCVGVPTNCPQGQESKGETCVLTDRDSDGIPDASDRCPAQAEDVDGFADDDGCPEDDVDRDGIPDRTDRCPLAAEDRNDFRDDDGCPDETERAMTEKASAKPPPANPEPQQPPPPSKKIGREATPSEQRYREALLEWETKRASAESSRTGWGVLFALGVVGVGAGTTLAIVGSEEDDQDLVDIGLGVFGGAALPFIIGFVGVATTRAPPKPSRPNVALDLRPNWIGVRGSF
jgi:hypothetical protein